MKINYNHIRDTYQIGCLLIVPPTTALCVYSHTNNHIDPSQRIRQDIGYATIGILVGFTYPISFPTAAIYTILDIRKNAHPTK